MKPGNFFALTLVACSFAIPSALAQITQPVQLKNGETRNASLDKNSPVLDSAARYDCYAINTAAKEEITVTLESSDFDPIIGVARGALCHASSLQYENDNIDSSTTTAQVSFKAPGGRYLVIVKSKSPEAMGSYRLVIGNGAAQQVATQAPSAKTQRRQQIMEMEIQQREAELAAARAKQEAERAAYEAQQAMIVASSRAEESYYEEEYEAPPQRNPFMVFAETLNSELAKQQQAEQEFQQGLDRAIRQGEAEHRRRVAAQQNAEAQRNAEALRIAAAQKAQAAERARIEAEALQKRSAQQVANNSTTSSAMRDPNSGVKAKPVGGSTTPSSTSRASTKSDPHLCISSPQQMRNPNCKDGTAFGVTNSCQEPVDLRICIRTVKGLWDCGVLYGVKAGARGSWPSCFGTSDVFVSARNSGSDIPLASPP